MKILEYIHRGWGHACISGGTHFAVDFFLLPQFLSCVLYFTHSFAWQACAAHNRMQQSKLCKVRWGERKRECFGWAPAFLKILLICIRYLIALLSTLRFHEWCGACVRPTHIFLVGIIFGFCFWQNNFCQYLPDMSMRHCDKPVAIKFPLPTISFGVRVAEVSLSHELTVKR